MKNYILIKLRSGEEIIASIMSKNRSGVKISRPMQIKQIPFVDHLSGTMKAAVVMENWIGRTDENEVTIPNNWIGVRMIPSKDMIDIYERYMYNEDINSKKVEIVTETSVVEADAVVSPKKEPKPDSESLKKFEEEMSKAIIDLIGDSNSPEKFNGIPPISPKDQTGKELVVVNFMFPAKLFKSMVEEGILDDLLFNGAEFQDVDDGEDLEEDEDANPKKKIQENFDKIDSGESNKETWGNSYKDWSPDPKDYM